MWFFGTIPASGRQLGPSSIQKPLNRPTTIISSYATSSPAGPASSARTLQTQSHLNGAPAPFLRNIASSTAPRRRHHRQPRHRAAGEHRAPPRSPRVTFIEGSITDLDLLMDTFPGADGIFHQAAIPSVPRSVKKLSPRTKPTCPGPSMCLSRRRAAGCRLWLPREFAYQGIRRAQEWAQIKKLPSL